MMSLVSSAGWQHGPRRRALRQRGVLDQLLARAPRTTIAYCLTNGSKAILRPFANTASKSGATKPNASNSKPPAAVWPTVAAHSVALPSTPHTTWCPCTLSANGQYRLESIPSKAVCRTLRECFWVVLSRSVLIAFQHRLRKNTWQEGHNRSRIACGPDRDRFSPLLAWIASPPGL